MMVYAQKANTKVVGGNVQTTYEDAPSSTPRSLMQN